MRKVLLACAAMAVLVSCGKKEEAAPAGTNVHITGNVKGFKKGRLFLTRVQDTVAVILDTINIDGSSEFKSDIKLDSPEMLYLVIDRVSSNSTDDNLAFFAEPGNINIDTKLDGFYAFAKIKAGENQKLYEQYLAQRKRINDRSLDLIQKELEVSSKKNVNKAQLDSIAEQKSRMEKRHYLNAANFAVTHGNFEVAPYLAVHEIPNINLKYLLMIQEKLTPKVKNSRYGKELDKLIAYRKENDSKVTAPAAPAK